MFTREEDKVWARKVLAKVRRLVTRPSMVEGECQYRGLHGARCAVGALFPDRLYSVDTCEFRGVHTLPAKVKKHIGATTAGRMHFLTRVQMAHDETALEQPKRLFVKRFHERLAAVADAFGLEEATAGKDIS